MGIYFYRSLIVKTFADRERGVFLELALARSKSVIVLFTLYFALISLRRKWVINFLADDGFAGNFQMAVVRMSFRKLVVISMSCHPLSLALKVLKFRTFDSCSKPFSSPSSLLLLLQYCLANCT